jgi:hypothetical protein
MKVGEIYNPYKKFKALLIPEAIARIPIKDNPTTGERGLSQGAKVCFGKLAEYSGKNGLCFPSSETLASGIGVSLRTAQDYILELKDFGLIYPDNGNFYFLWHEILEDSTTWRGSSTRIPASQNADSRVSNADSRVENDPSNNVLRGDLNRPSEVGVFPLPLPELLSEENPTNTDTPSVREEYNPCDEEGVVVEQPKKGRMQWGSRKKETKAPGCAAIVRAAADARRHADEAVTRTLAIPSPRNGVSTPPPPSAAPTSSFTGDSFVEVWRSKVGPMEWDPLRQDRTLCEMLERIAKDSRFTDNFSIMCDKAAAIHKNHPEATWLTFRWMLKSKEGTEGWWKVYIGDLDGMANNKQASTTKNFAHRSPTQELIEKYRAMAEEEKKAKENS